MSSLQNYTSDFEHPLCEEGTKIAGYWKSTKRKYFGILSKNWMNSWKFSKLWKLKVIKHGNQLKELGNIGNIMVKVWNKHVCGSMRGKVGGNEEWNKWLTFLVLEISCSWRRIGFLMCSCSFWNSVFLWDTVEVISRQSYLSFTSLSFIKLFPLYFLGINYYKIPGDG